MNQATGRIKKNTTRRSRSRIVSRPCGYILATFSFNGKDRIVIRSEGKSVANSNIQRFCTQPKQLVAVNRPDGVTVNYLYEGDAGLPAPNPNTGRLKIIRQPRGDTTFGYAPVVNGIGGQLQSITAPDGGSLSYTYDGSLLLSTTWKNPNGSTFGSVSRTYDNNFWVTSEKVNNANQVNFTYDLDGLLTGANTTVNGSAVNFTINRDVQNGLITGSSIGGVSDSISYNGFAEPIGYSATFNGSNLYNVSYVRDAAGRISSKTETLNGVTTTLDYHYDLAGRLTGVDKNGVPSSSYTYDSNGNRLSYSDGSVVRNGVYDEQDRLLSYGDFVYEYTANGELKKKINTVTGEVWLFGYEDFGALMSVSLPTGHHISYSVDAKARRIGKSLDGVFVRGYLYGPMERIIAEVGSGGTVTSRFIYGTRFNSPDYLVRNGVTYRYIHDQIGSVRFVVNTSSGVVVEQIDYDEFGGVLSDTNPDFQPFGFAGGLHDVDTGLIRFGVRDYDPNSGRWANQDPIGFKGGDPNLYAYVANDPVNFLDADGTVTMEEVNRMKSLVDANNLSGQDAWLIVCMAWAESSFNPHAQQKDPNTARGLLQVTKLALQDMDGYSYEDLLDPAKNIQAGTEYLALRIKRAKGNVRKGLAGYGEGTAYADKLLDCQKCMDSCPSPDCLTSMNKKK